MEALLPLKEFVEALADLKIHSTGDFMSLKRKGEIPDGITDRPLQAYSELKGEWRHLWNKVHAVRLVRGENLEERKPPSVEDLESFIKGMANGLNEHDEHELAGDIPEEEFSAEIEDRSQKERGSVKSYRDRTKGKKSGRAKAPAGSSSGISRKTAEPSPYDSPEKREKKILELMAGDAEITIAKMVEETKLSRATIDRTIVVLKREGRLARIGAKTGGYWQILQKGDRPDDPLKEREEKLLELIAENNRITKAQMAENMKVSRSTIDRMLAGLKQDGRLTRVGIHNGYWHISQEGDSGLL